VKHPRVKEVIKAADKGIESVVKYLNQEGMVVDPSTWCGQIKKSIEENHVISVLAEIEILKEKFNYYVSKEERSSTGTRTINGKGHTTD
jgi:hypothetical protein